MWHPTSDRLLVLIEKPDEEKRSRGGILIPQNVADRGTKEGYVICVGPGRVTDYGETVLCPAEIGDTILFHVYAGNEVEMEDGTKCLMLNGHDVLAIKERKKRL